MVKEIEKIYKHCQYQLPTSSFKAPVNPSLASQASYSIKLTTTYVPSVREKSITIKFWVPKIPSRMI